MVLSLNSLATEAPCCEKILSFTQNQLAATGTLKSSNGFVYVDVDDDYIHKLIKFIQPYGFEEPPYFGNPGLVGAHITVIYPDEAEKYALGELKECGETITFKPKGCMTVQPPNWEEVTEVYFLVVNAPKLDKIRKKYELPKREYDFHITIGVKPMVN